MQKHILSWLAVLFFATASVQMRRKVRRGLCEKSNKGSTVFYADFRTASLSSASI